jgi:hypothetical protein
MIGGAHPKAPQCIKILRCLLYRYRVTLATNLESGMSTYFYGYTPGHIQLRRQQEQSMHAPAGSSDFGLRTPDFGLFLLATIR